MQSPFLKTAGAGLFYSLVFVLGFWTLLAEPVRAHKVSSASLILYIDTEEERSYRISIAMEVESSGDAALDDEIGPEDAARAFAENYLAVLIDEKEQSKTITTELVNTSDPGTPKELQRLSVLVEWKDSLPPEGKELALFLKETSEMSIVMATVKNGITGRRLQVLFAGEYSKAVNVEPLMKGNPFEEAARTEVPKEEVENPAVPPESSSPRAGGRLLLGAKATLETFGLALCLLIALLLLSDTSQIAARAFAVFLVSFSVGLSLAGFALMPHFPRALPVVAVAVLLLSLENLFAEKFLWWRYLPGAVGAFFLGNHVIESGSFHRLGSPRSRYRSSFPTSPDSCLCHWLRRCCWVQFCFPLAVSSGFTNRS